MESCNHTISLQTYETTNYYDDDDDDSGSGCDYGYNAEQDECNEHCTSAEADATFQFGVATETRQAKGNEKNVGINPKVRERE